MHFKQKKNSKKSLKSVGKGGTQNPMDQSDSSGDDAIWDTVSNEISFQAISSAAITAYFHEWSETWEKNCLMKFLYKTNLAVMAAALGSCATFHNALGRKQWTAQIKRSGV